MLWLTVGGVLAGSALLGGLVASGEATSRRLRARRRAGRAGLPATGGGDWLLRDPQLAAAVLTALGQLRRELPGRNLPLPGVEAVFVRGNQLVLRMAGSQPAPPPPPWRPEDGEAPGRSWVVDTGQLGQRDEGPMPYPMLTAIGRCGGWTVLVDLARSPGPISMAGDPDQAAGILQSLAFELASSPWSGGVRMVAVGLAGRIVVPDPGRIRHLPSGSEGAALAAGGTGPLVVLLGRPPEHGAEDALARIAGDIAGDFAGDPDHPVTMICLGRSRLAGWTFEVRPDGRFRLPPGGPVLEPLTAEVPAAAGAAEPAPPPAAAPAVLVDWRRFRELIGSGEAATEPARLRTALGLIRAEPGPAIGPATGRPPPEPDPDSVAAVLWCVRRVAELAARAGNPTEAEWALRQGLRLLPHLEGLWRTLLRFQAEHQPAAVDRTATEMAQALARCRPGHRLERPTRRLLARLDRLPVSAGTAGPALDPGGGRW